MKAWVREKARRLVVAGAVAFAVGAPTIACMGGDTGSSDGGEVTDGDEPEDDDEGIKERLQGTWQYMPAEDDHRMLRIINATIDGKKKAIENLKPFSPEEQAAYDMYKGLPKSSPEVKSVKGLIASIKGSKVEFDGNDFALDTDEGRTESTFTVEDEDGDEATIVVKEGPTGEKETHELEFVSDKEVKDRVTTPSGLEFNFVLKK